MAAGKFHCDVCSSDCTNRVRIRCAVCNEYDLCVPCFANGSATANHKPWHAYRIIEQHAYPIFDKDWGADEELLLIEGAEQLGLGNWQDVSDHIGSRTKEEVGEHYTRCYLQSKDYPLPETDTDLSHITPQVFAAMRKERLERLERKKNGPLPPPKPKASASVPLCHEIQGYMPGRMEFEHEVEDEAEHTVKEMIFDPDDQPNDIDLKLTILDIYNSRLTTRAERKRIMLLNGLLEYRKNITLDKKRLKEEKEVLKKINAMIRVMTPADFEDFLRDILTELRCRIRIQQLQTWRRNGIRTAEAGNRFEKDKIVRLNALQRFGAGSALSSRHTANSIASNALGTPRGRGSATPQPETKPPKKNINQPLDISGAADFDLLSQDEKILCASLRMYPKPYMAIKHQLMRDAAKSDGVLKKKEVRQSLKIDVNKASKIFEFFVTQRWINQG
ncbi:hypothetical protein BABINDRAFT_160099 [Babjeviella inositovora NRRL Y-12698]|uniref:Transcriptional adapter 2 n=1 Tax=Babjeviella inositovora NRRL Y-12698 TaxID=984486 RepID=A0A1E3QW27_9ASCO|nr:uncharacterized protein BABINDRAFT_160099 [Babjeviella inositovora NRRL Y-12698]ODQ81869.1 hypothetical protein BABINDRAFT_160099 [Babjeviella inositovora NRRL Y-12698]